MSVGGNPGRSNSDNKDQQYKEQVKPDLLDFLFTLALTIGIAPELVGRNGLASYSWKIAIPELPFLVNMGGFFLGITTLLFSWYGFNASISNKPVLYGSVAGMFRFSLDALLVVLYGFMLILFNKIDILVVLLMIIFFLYTIWDLLKLIEYRKPPFNFENSDIDLNSVRPMAREIRSTIGERRSGVYFFFVFIVGLFHLLPIFEQFGHWKDLFTIANLLIITTIYRIDKVKCQIRGDKQKVERVENEYS